MKLRPLPSRAAAFFMRRAVRRKPPVGSGTGIERPLFYVAEQAGRAREFRHMANERDEDLRSKQSGSATTGQQSQDSELGAREQRGAAAGSHQQSDGMEGQPIGGNDSATGTGTTLTQGADFAAQSQSGPSGSGTLAANDDSDLGQGTTSNAGGSAVGTDQTSGASSGISGGEGFVGSRADDSSEYLREGGGTDFAKQGRGAAKEDDDQSSGS
jgi:hypothetical protein